jgi:hypothetical protein
MLAMIIQDKIRCKLDDTGASSGLPLLMKEGIRGEVGSP